MATKSTGPIDPRKSCNLGNYRFSIHTEESQEDDITVVIAMCEKYGQSPVQKTVSFPKNTSIEKWWIEANDTIADVYALVSKVVGFEKKSELLEGITVPCSNSTILTGNNGNNEKPKFDIDYFYDDFPADTYSVLMVDKDRDPWISEPLFASDHEYVTYETKLKTYKAENGEISFKSETTNSNNMRLRYTYTHDGKTVFYISGRRYFYQPDKYGKFFIASPYLVKRLVSEATLAWTMVFGEIEKRIEKRSDKLIARFEIDPHDAGGTGPGSDWTDPGDWNENPNTVLNVDIEGALSGRHNDIFDTSYRYIPSDQDSVAGYGCGGDGGHGGGGGAGASTIIVRKFGTDKANSKNIVARPKRHGYGSGGGKGGKGGDGCILIYY